MDIKKIIEEKCNIVVDSIKLIGDAERSIVKGYRRREL